MAMVRQFDEETVLGKVLDVFWAQGWQATSMADLAAATQVQRGSLYHAYGGKEQLFELAFERYAARVLDESQQALRAPSARLALQQFFALSIADMTSATPPRGCFTTRSALECAQIGPQMQARVRAVLERMEAVIAQALSHGAMRASLSTSPESAARIIIAFSRGVAVMERVYDEPTRLQELADQIIALLVTPDKA